MLVRYPPTIALSNMIGALKSKSASAFLDEFEPANSANGSISIVDLVHHQPRLPILLLMPWFWGNFRAAGLDLFREPCTA